jgi:hypothetical protein
MHDSGDNPFRIIPVAVKVSFNDLGRWTKYGERMTWM